MDQDEQEILDLFFTLLNKVRDVLVINRPEISEYMKLRNFQDPFGKIFQVILYLGENQSSTMTEFATRFKLKAGTATGIIDQLVGKKLIARKTNPEDRRKVEIVLTELGEVIYNKAVEIQRDEIKSVLDALNHQDIIHVKQILKKVNDALVIKERKAIEPEKLN